MSVLLWRRFLKYRHCDLKHNFCTYYFIGGLFRNIVSTSECVVPNSENISEKNISEITEKETYVAELQAQYLYLPAVTKKNH